LRRIGLPEDVAELALFMASAKARHIQAPRSRSMARHAGLLLKVASVRSSREVGTQSIKIVV